MQTVLKFFDLQNFFALDFHRKRLFTTTRNEKWKEFPNIRYIGLDDLVLEF